MESLEQELFDTKFIDSWYVHYHQLAAYLEQNSHGDLLALGAMDAELVKWISIQGKLKNKLPRELRSKLAALNFNFDEKADIWEYRYRQLADFVKTHGHLQLPANNEQLEDLKDWYLRQIQHKSYLSESQVHKLELLGINWDIVITRDQRWEQLYGRLKEFRQTYGHCQVPQNWPPDQTLANWVGVQRRMYATHKIRPDREAKLNALHFIWNINAVYDAHWQQHYQALKLFYQQHGHGQVPGSNKQLTSWIENQRTAKKNKTLLPDRERQLNELGFIWSFKAIKQDNWQKRYKQLAAYKKKHGHCFVPVKYKEDPSLGYWVAAQRKLEALGQLREEKKQKLDRLGFVWSSSTQTELQSAYDAQWNLNYERLKIYQQVYGTCQVSVKLNPVLQRWTRWQRILFYEGKLSAERLAKLNEVRFPWNVQEGYWMKMYQALADFKGEFKHTRVPYQWAANRALAAWVYRMKKNKAELTPQKVELLDMIGFDWHWHRKTVVSWEQMYARLLQYKQEHGHTRVPVKWPQDPKLGKWVSRMRQEKDKLYPERRALLNQIDFDWGKRMAYK